MNFVRIELRLLEGVHIGAGRAGMVSRAHGFVPGHVVAYAIAAILGRRLGGQPEDYETAIASVRAQCRGGPLFIQAEDQNDQPISLLPRRDRARIERDYFIGVNHTTLDGSVRRHVDGGLFEVEAIAPCRQRPDRQPTRLAGGLWLNSDGRVLGEDLKALLGAAPLVLGGERNAGLGRVVLEKWDENAGDYAGLGLVQPGEEGLRLAAGQILPGPALEGVMGVGWQPWFGRLHDQSRGAGRRFSAPVLVRLDGQVSQPTTFVLECAESGFGCWKPLCPAS